MHDVTLVYTEYNHRLEVWVLGKRAANTTADRQQYTNTSKVCDDTMSMVFSLRLYVPITRDLNRTRSFIVNDKLNLSASSLKMPFVELASRNPGACKNIFC